MAATLSSVCVEVRLPAWAKPYLFMCMLLSRAGVDIDFDKVREKIVSSTRVSIVRPC